MEEVPKEANQKELGAGAGLGEGWAGRKGEDARGTASLRRGQKLEGGPGSGGWVWCRGCLAAEETQTRSEREGS